MNLIAFEFRIYREQWRNETQFLLWMYYAVVFGLFQVNYKVNLLIMLGFPSFNVMFVLIEFQWNADNACNWLPWTAQSFCVTIYWRFAREASNYCTNYFILIFRRISIYQISSRNSIRDLYYDEKQLHKRSHFHHDCSRRAHISRRLIWTTEKTPVETKNQTQQQQN